MEERKRRRTRAPKQLRSEREPNATKVKVEKKDMNAVAVHRGAHMFARTRMPLPTKFGPCPHRGPKKCFVSEFQCGYAVAVDDVTAQGRPPPRQQQFRVPWYAVVLYTTLLLCIVHARTSIRTRRTRVCVWVCVRACL